MEFIQNNSNVIATIISWTLVLFVLFIAIFLLATFLITWAQYSFRCAIFIHQWHPREHKSMPGMAVDTKANRVIKIQAYYKRCKCCSKIKTTRVEYEGSGLSRRKQ